MYYYVLTDRYLVCVWFGSNEIKIDFS